jgi:hypothetical protein
VATSSAGVSNTTLALEAVALRHCQTQPGHAPERSERDGYEIACPPCLRLTVLGQLTEQTQPTPVEIHPDLTGPNLEVLRVLGRALLAGEKLTADQIAQRCDPPLSGTATAGARIRDLRNQPYNYPIPAEHQSREYVYWLDRAELDRRRSIAAHPAGTATGDSQPPTPLDRDQLTL